MSFTIMPSLQILRNSHTLECNTRCTRVGASGCAGDKGGNGETRPAGGGIESTRVCKGLLPERKQSLQECSSSCLLMDLMRAY